MTIDRIRVMISSRCKDYETADGGRFPLARLRQALKQAIEAGRLFGQPLFECWLNEEEAARPAGKDLWQVCLDEVRRAHLVLVLANGHSGWGSEAGGIGICRAELQAALFSGRDRTVLIGLPDARDADDPRHAEFRRMVAGEQVFSPPAAGDLAAVQAAVLAALADAVIRLSRSAALALRRDSYALGEALDWSRLDFHHRKQAMEAACVARLLAREGRAPDGADPARAIAITVGTAKVLFCIHAIPAALSVAAARELVGRPFLTDHERIAADAEGPVHLILCHKTATEKQATDLLGFPDATVVATSFGIYLVDPVQKIQFVLLANCRDAGSTGFAVQRLFDWLERSGERDALVRRAESRKRIVSLIREEIGDPAAVPTPVAGAPTSRAGAPARRRRPRRSAA